MLLDNHCSLFYYTGMPKIKKNQNQDNCVRGNPLKILDIDLDFFLESICYGGDAHGNRRIN